MPILYLFLSLFISLIIAAESDNRERGVIAADNNRCSSNTVPTTSSSSSSSSQQRTVIQKSEGGRGRLETSVAGAADLRLRVEAVTNRWLPVSERTSDTVDANQGDILNSGEAIFRVWGGGGGVSPS